MTYSLEDIAARISALNLWDAVGPFHFALRPRGTVMPYFFALMKGEQPHVKMRLLLLEGWQTFHDFLRTNIDRFYGYYQTPMELPHFELVFLVDGKSRLFRHDSGFMPRDPSEEESALAAKMLWEVYGLMMRLETDRQLPMKFAAEKSLFSRLEDAKGKWSDEAFPIFEPPPYKETVRLSKEDIAKAKDLPFVREESIEVDFFLDTKLMTKEKRPRCVYRLVSVDSAVDTPWLDDRVSVGMDGGLKSLWEGVPAQLLKRLIERGRIPGEIKMRSGRLFRLMRPLSLEIPFRLSLHDELLRLKN